MNFIDKYACLKYGTNLKKYYQNKKIILGYFLNFNFIILKNTIFFFGTHRDIGGIWAFFTKLFILR
jgi:hypothetical protein